MKDAHPFAGCSSRPGSRGGWQRSEMLGFITLSPTELSASMRKLVHLCFGARSDQYGGNFQCVPEKFLCWQGEVIFDFILN
ncbi:MAG: hypothetical protein Q7S71_00095 [Candidatus Nitrotoga sp.]|nr:hypothetical protein [Candidatus Nitrotoga sp.]